MAVYALHLLHIKSGGVCIKTFTAGFLAPLTRWDISWQTSAFTVATLLPTIFLPPRFISTLNLKKKKEYIRNSRRTRELSFSALPPSHLVGQDRTKQIPSLQSCYTVRLISSAQEPQATVHLSSLDQLLTLVPCEHRTESCRTAVVSWNRLLGADCGPFGPRRGWRKAIFFYTQPAPFAGDAWAGFVIRIKTQNTSTGHG